MDDEAEDEENTRGSPDITAEDWQSFIDALAKAEGTVREEPSWLKGIPEENIIRIGPQPLYDKEGKPVPCEISGCQAAAAEPIVAVGDCPHPDGQKKDILLRLCPEHHPEITNKWDAVKKYVAEQLGNSGDEKKKQKSTA